MSDVCTEPVVVISEVDKSQALTSAAIQTKIGAVFFGPDPDHNTFPAIPRDWLPTHAIEITDALCHGEVVLSCSVTLTNVPVYPVLPTGTYEIRWSGEVTVASGLRAETVTWTNEVLASGAATGGWGTPKPANPTLRVPYVYASVAITPTIEFRYPVRKRADIYSHSRYGLDGLGNTFDWGHYFLSLERTIDVSPYFRDVQINQCYWPWDGDATAKVTCLGTTKQATVTAGFNTAGQFLEPANVGATVLLDYQPWDGYYHNGAGNLSAIIDLLHLGQAPGFETYSDSQDIDLGWANHYQSTVAASGGRITVTGNTELLRVQGYYAAADVVSLTADFQAADGKALPDGLTVAAYSPPGQPPSVGDDWYSMPYLTDISFTGPGSYTDTCCHYDLACWGDEGTTFDVEAADGDRTAAIACAISPGDLLAAELEPAAWRYPLPIPVTEARWIPLGYYPIPEIIVFDDGTHAAEWTAGGGGTLSQTGAGMKLTGASGKTMSRVLGADDVSVRSCRWLVLKITAPATGTGTFEACGHTWDFDLADADASGQIFLDTCAPGDASGNDTTETRYDTTGWGWGLFLPTTFVLTFNTADDVVVRSLGLDGSRGSGNQYHLMSEVVGRIPGYGDERRGIWFAQDGHVILDESIGTVSEAVDNDPDPPTRDLPLPYTIQGVYDEITEEISASTDVYARGPWLVFDNDMNAPAVARMAVHTQYLGRNEDGTADDESQDFYYGVQWWNNGREAFNFAPVVEHTAGATYLEQRAHAWADRIEFAPGTASAITTRKIFGGRLTGLVCDASTQRGVPEAGVTVTSTGNTYSLTTDADGFFISPHLYQTGDHSAELTADALVTDSVTTMHHGRRARICLPGVAVVSSGLDLLIDELTGIGAVAYVTDEGQLLVQRTFSMGRQWEAPRVISATSPSHPCLIVNSVGMKREWGLAWVESGTVYLGWTTDGYLSLTGEATTLTDVSHVRAVVHPVSGVMLVAGYDTVEGEIVCARSFDLGATLSAAVTVASCDEQAFGLTPAPDALNRWVISYKGASSVETCWSTDNGLSWQAAS